jgi:hypothetical protein
MDTAKILFKTLSLELFDTAAFYYSEKPRVYTAIRTVRMKVYSAKHYQRPTKKERTKLTRIDYLAALTAN